MLCQHATIDCFYPSAFALELFVFLGFVLPCLTFGSGASVSKILMVGTTLGLALVEKKNHSRNKTQCFAIQHA
jgi:hypothetical protein